MGDSLSGRFSKIFQTTNEESWIVRVKQNARAFFELRGAALAHGGPSAFDLIEERPAPGTRQRQAGSLIVHAVVIGIVVWLGGRVAKNGPNLSGLLPDPGHLVFPGMLPAVRQDKPASGNGAGGARNELPPTVGELARRSWVVVLHPRVPDQREHALPVEPTVFGAEERRRVSELGLPWMKEKTNSNGTNGTDGMGDKPGHTMGTNNGDDEGFSDANGPYRAAAYAVKCSYCPDPEYTDEARHEKLQGSVTMRVLVTPDGRAGQIRIVRGLGLGLDERAVEKVRTWRFQPARDANKNAIAEWVTVEATYRLF
jgi:protein TonB